MAAGTVAVEVKVVVVDVVAVKVSVVLTVVVVKPVLMTVPHDKPGPVVSRAARRRAASVVAAGSGRARRTVVGAVRFWNVTPLVVLVRRSLVSQENAWRWAMPLCERTL